MKTPERTTAAAFQRYLSGEVLALHWTGLYVRLCRLPRVVDSFLVPATPEPLITCNAKGSAEFRERDVGGAWITRKIEPGAMFVTHSKTPYEVRWTSPAGQEIEVIQIHLAVDVFRTALATTYPGKADQVEVIDFFGRDDALAHLCYACADMLTARTRGNTRRVADLTQLFASYLVEKYTDAARERSEVRGGLPIRQLHKVEDYVSERLAEEISVETLAGLVELSPFHFSRVFKQTTGLSPLQFVTPRAHHPRPADNAGNQAQPDRDRARSRLHQPERLRASLPPRRRRHADGVSRRFVKKRAQARNLQSLAPATIRHAGRRARRELRQPPRRKRDTGNAPSARDGLRPWRERP